MDKEKYIEQINNAIQQIDKIKWNAVYHCNQITLAINNNYLHKVVLQLIGDNYFDAMGRHLNVKHYKDSLSLDDINEDEHFVQDLRRGLIEKLLNFRAVCDYKVMFLKEKINENRDYTSGQQKLVLKAINTFRKNTSEAAEAIVKNTFNCELITPKVGDKFDSAIMKENYVLDSVIDDIRDTNHGKALGKFVLNVNRPAVKENDSNKILIKAITDIDNVTLHEKYSRLRIT